MTFALSTIGLKGTGRGIGDCGVVWPKADRLLPVSASRIAKAITKGARRNGKVNLDLENIMSNENSSRFLITLPLNELVQQIEQCHTNKNDY